MTNAVDDRTGEINYQLAIPLDAENLAETGIQDAYLTLIPHLTAHGVQALPITETIDAADGAYEVECDGRRYPISGPNARGNSWGLATHALFDIVNQQLSSTDIGLYALNGGNDLFGIFMSPAQAEHARRSLRRKTDWPYLPTTEPRWFGMYHD